ncbi:hypothetical protein D3C72_1375650 [compost metagenome]
MGGVHDGGHIAAPVFLEDIVIAVLQRPAGLGQIDLVDPGIVAVPGPYRAKGIGKVGKLGTELEFTTVKRLIGVLIAIVGSQPGTGIVLGTGRPAATIAVPFIGLMAYP